MPTSVVIPYDRTKFPEHIQLAYEDDIVTQLSEDFLEYPTLLAHAKEIVCWTVADFQEEPPPLFTLIDQVEAYLIASGITEMTDRETIEKEIAPRVLEIIIREIKPEFLLLASTDEQQKEMTV